MIYVRDFYKNLFDWSQRILNCFMESIKFYFNRWDPTDEHTVTKFFTLRSEIAESWIVTKIVTCELWFGFWYVENLTPWATAEYLGIQVSVNFIDFGVMEKSRVRCVRVWLQ